VNHSLDILDLCRSLSREGCSVAIATHDLNSVHRFVDEVALIESGRIAAIGSPESVLTPANLARAFQVQSERLLSPDGTPMLLFRRLTHEMEAELSHE
jgi:iron complex transport system ATP-binding protein